VNEPETQTLQDRLLQANHDFQQRLGDYQRRVDHALNAHLPLRTDAGHRLSEAMRYAVIGGGGKRIRPAMVYAAGEAMGAALEVLDTPAAAVEMIHAYSLIHDDLPAMDDDDLRRGQPTCHKAYDEATAILAGDALQAHAFEIMAHADIALDAERRLDMIRLLTEASGARGMAGGQAMDLASVGHRLSRFELEAMHRMKTGALIRASILLGAMCSPSTTRQDLAVLGQYADCVGLSFQIQDDILDVVGDTETLGKPSGSDQKMQKPTYPSIIGLEESYVLAMAQHEQAMAHLDELPRDNEHHIDTLRQLSAYIVQRKY
jgi:farnesyl diphosphate synthase